MLNRTLFMVLIAGTLSMPAISPAAQGTPGGDLAALSGIHGAGASGEFAKPSVVSPAASFLFTEEFFATTGAPPLTDDRVKAQIRHFMTTGRPLLQNWLDRSARFIPLMKGIFREHNLPEDLVYVAMIESGLRMNAISRSRAVGPWQFMATTAREYGLMINEWVDERRDPVKSTHAAAAFLHDLYGRFGSWHLALAAYNAGAGKIRRALDRSRDDGFADIYASRLLVQETRNYVPKLMAAITIARNREQYGFTEKYNKAFSYEELKIEKSVDLYEIAIFAGCSREDIKKLNPEIESRTTPPYARDYVLRIPVGTKQRYLASLNLFPRDLAPGKPRFDEALSHIDKGRTHVYALLRRRDPSSASAITL